MPIGRIRRRESGLTLVEILVSLALLVILAAGMASTILSSQFFSSYSRHKIQAAYAAQQILEQQRRTAFSAIATQASAAVTLDTKGTYNTTADDFNGNRVITVTSIDAYRKMVQVEINWQEQVASGKITAREYFKTTIANEPEYN